MKTMKAAQDGSTDGRIALADEDGAEVHFDTPGLKLPIICCDCGLAHTIEVEVSLKGSSIKITPNDELTAKARYVRDVTGHDETQAAFLDFCPSLLIGEEVP